MNIPQGYKQTELGLIPEDWEVTTIKQIADITTGNKNTQDAEDGGKYPFYVRSQNVERINSYSYDSEGVVTAGDGVGTGKIFHYARGKFGLHQRAYLIYNFKDFDSQYFYWYFSQYFYDRINQMTAKSSVDSVRKEMIEDMCILRAPIAEQRAIAEALSDVDGLIAALDKKIAKKRLIKQGAMQQLLTGKKRLPGFSDEWVEKKLGKISHIKTGSRNGDQAVENGKYPFFVRSQKVYAIDTYSFDGEAILVPGEGGIGNIFHYINGKFDFHQRVYKISDFANEVCGKFIYFYMSRYFGEYALSLTVKATVDSLRLPTFEEFVIHMPSNVKEQEAIATILSDIDKEIADLETQRDKYRLLKSGMMQKLLTGQIRLKRE